MKLKKLLPLVGFAGLTATVAPVVTSCNKTPEEESVINVNIWDDGTGDRGMGIYSLQKDVIANETYKINFDLSKCEYGDLNPGVTITCSVGTSHMSAVDGGEWWLNGQSLTFEDDKIFEFKSPDIWNYKKTLQKEGTTLTAKIKFTEAGKLTLRLYRRSI